MSTARLTPSRDAMPDANVAATLRIRRSSSAMEYHEALQNVTPADMFHGRQAAILSRRARIKQRTLQQSKRGNLHTPHHAAIRSKVSLRNGAELSNLV